MNCNTYTQVYVFFSCVLFVPVFQLASPRTYCSSRHVQTKGTGQGGEFIEQRRCEAPGTQARGTAPLWNRNGTHDYLKRVWGYAVRAMYHAVIREALEKFGLPVELTTRVANDTAPLGINNTGPPWPDATWGVFERKLVDYFTNTSTDLL